MEFIDAYEEHFQSVYGFHGYRLRSKAETEDLTQETFERALGAWDRFDPSRGELRTWLLAIARNVYIDHRRRQGARPQTVVVDLGEEPEVQPQVSPEERIGVDPELANALRRLSRREREAIALRFGGDLPTREIAELLGVSLSNAQQILSRALRRLKSILEAEGDLEISPPTHFAQLNLEDRPRAGGGESGDSEQGEPGSGERGDREP